MTNEYLRKELLQINIEIRKLRNSHYKSYERERRLNYYLEKKRQLREQMNGNREDVNERV